MSQFELTEAERERILEAHVRGEIHSHVPPRTHEIGCPLWIHDGEKGLECTCDKSLD